MADGRTFIGQQAVDAGLVDGIQTIDQLVEAMATNPRSLQPAAKPCLQSAPQRKSKRLPVSRRLHFVPSRCCSKPKSPSTPTERNVPMDRATLRRSTRLFAALQTEFATAGAAAERQRIADVRPAPAGSRGADRNPRSRRQHHRRASRRRRARCRAQPAPAHASARAAAALSLWPKCLLARCPLPATLPLQLPPMATTATPLSSAAPAARDGNANLRAEFAGLSSAPAWPTPRPSAAGQSSRPRSNPP